MNSRIAGSVALICGVGLVSIFNAAPADEQQPHPETTRLIESVQGPALFKAYCAVCHGKVGRGDGPMAVSLKTKLPDLTRISARNGGAFPLAQVRHIISGDKPLPAGHGTKEMPVWGPIFSQISWDQDLGQVRIYNLAKYLEGIQVK